MSDVSHKPSTFRALLRSRNAVIGLSIVSVFMFCALLAPHLTSHDPYDVNLEIKELPPSPFF